MRARRFARDAALAALLADAGERAAISAGLQRMKAARVGDVLDLIDTVASQPAAASKRRR